MTSLNRVELIGNLGADPEIRHTQDRRPIANLRIATSEQWKDKQTGEQKEKTEWHSVVCFVEGLCGVIEKYLRKGHKVYVAGQLQTRQWEDKDGVTRYTTECVLNGFNAQLILLEKPTGNRPPPPEGPEQYGRENTRQQDNPQPMQRPQPGGMDPQAPLDDQIPF